MEALKADKCASTVAVCGTPSKAKQGPLISLSIKLPGADLREMKTQVHTKIWTQMWAVLYTIAKIYKYPKCCGCRTGKQTLERLNQGLYVNTQQWRGCVCVRSKTRRGTSGLGRAGFTSMDTLRVNSEGTMHFVWQGDGSCTGKGRLCQKLCHRG